MDREELTAALGGDAAGQRLARRPSLSTDVYDVIMDMLLNHTLAPGFPLNIDGLARVLGVSPTPVREALARIESEGLIVREPRRGYTVAPLIGLDELRELIELRLLIEPATAAAAASHASSVQARDLRSFARTGGSGKSGPTANRLDMAYDAHFHDTVAEMAGNQLTREALVRLRSHLHMYRRYHHAGQAAATKPEHLAIAKAIVDRDPEEAATAMRLHLVSALDRLETVFASADSEEPAPDQVAGG